MSQRRSATSATYTHIIVGAGSAGCVLAEGLSADPRHRVLLVEAGPDYVRVPLPSELDDGTTPAIGSHDWGLQADVGDGRTAAMPRGRVVGGTSQINSCIALRPEPSDFDQLSRASALWTWSRLVRCLEEVEDDLDFPASPHVRGRLRIRRTPGSEQAFPAKAITEACLAAGSAFVPNHNSSPTSGVGPAPLNLTEEGVRISSRLAFLEPARARDNLEVLSDTMVHRVIVTNGRAEGIEYSAGDAQDVFVSADTVVLAAGAYGSPVILQRSGIGPRRLLEHAEIPVVADLPGVGANLSDHTQVPVVFTYRGNSEARRSPCVEALLRYSSGSPDSVTNDMQLCMINHVNLLQYDAELSATWGTAHASSLTANLMAPRMRGSVHIDPAAPRSETSIRFEFVRHPSDLAKLREGVRLVCRMLEASSFSERLLRLERPASGQLDDDAALDAWIRERFQPGYHPMGTARIGRAGDFGAVVSDELGVRDVRGLHVADASVFPTPIRANTNLAVMAVARNAVHILRSDRYR